MELDCDWLEDVVAALSWEKPLWLDSRLVIEPLRLEQSKITYEKLVSLKTCTYNSVKKKKKKVSKEMFRFNILTKKQNKNKNLSYTASSVLSVHVQSNTQMQDMQLGK